MQRRRSASGSFPEIVDLDKGQVSNNTTSMSEQHTGFNNMLNPVESRLSNCTVSSSAEAHRTDDIEPNVHSFRGWSLGESSTTANQQTNDVINLGHGFVAEENNNNKRKSLEGSSAMSYECGNSSFFPQAESPWTDPARNNASSSLNLPTYPWNPSNVNPPPGQLDPRTGADVRGAVSESSLRNSGRRGHHQESLPLNLSSEGSTRCFNVWSQRPVLFSDSQDLRPTASWAANSSARSHTISRNMLAYPWNGVINNSTSGNFGERVVTVRQDEGNSRSVQMNDTERLVPRNMSQDTASWSVVSTGRISTPSTIIRDGVSSNIHPSLPTPNWAPHPSPSSTHSQQRLWSPFPSIEAESVGHGSSQYLTFSSYQEAVVSSGSSSSQQGHRRQQWRTHAWTCGFKRHRMFRRGYNFAQDKNPGSATGRQPHGRSGFSMERQGGGVLGMPHSSRALAADIEGGGCLISEIRQALSAIHRGENLPIEDFMLLDPFIYHGMAEMHGRHRDMRLDVDSMSYEEEYTDGDDFGMLDCGHDFHTSCIKRWLVDKNLCPICKTTALVT